MSAKYSGLPDIDQAPDVYETPDEPDLMHPREDEDNEGQMHVTLPSSDNIDQGSLPPRSKAERIFQAFNDESLSQPKESQLNRLRRLQAEIAQLELEVNKSTSSSTTKPSSSAASQKSRHSVVPPRFPPNLVSELSTLRDKLGRASAVAQRSERDPNEVTTRLSQLEKPTLGTSAVERPHSPHDAKIGDVDKRLSELERLVGVAGNQHDVVSLSDTIGRLNNLVHVLTQPRHVDTISRRIKALLNDLDRASAQNNVPTSSAHNRPHNVTLSIADNERLEALFELLPRMDPLLPIIPPLVTRLRSLSALHSESMAIAADLRELQSSEGAISEEERELHSIVVNVQQGMSDSVASISSNWQSVQTRLLTLDERLTRIDMK